MMRIKNSDLIAAILIAALNVVWTQIPNRPLLVGIIFALPLTFILPGYTLTQVLTRKRSPDQALDAHSFMLQSGHQGCHPFASLRAGSERSEGSQPVGGVDQLTLSLGLSLAVDVLVGFTLNVFPIGLQALSWALSLGLLTTIFALLAVFLRRRDIVQVTRVPRLRVTIYDGILFGLAILVATAAIWFAIIRPLEPQSSFTQFWMLPANQANKSCAVSIGVQNFELTLVTYHVVMAVDGTQASSWSSIVLAPRKEWVRSVLLMPRLASSMSIEAQLYRVDKPDTVYRNVHLTFYIAAGSKDGQVQQQCTLRT
jgi:uncharacterized membrane protein